ncbi:MAG: nicotinate-nicotinamide nucleotide adenylyltransferase [Planctomycetota bacterium]
MQDTPPITPWPVPKEAPVLLFGGSFDPPHRAHVDLAVAARDHAMDKATWLVVVPAARSPHKSAGPGASDADRLEMLALAFAGVPRVAVWADELDRAGAGGPSYWADTLERADRARVGLAGVRFLIGGDQVTVFHRWHRAGDILALCEPLVLPRGEIDSPAALDAQLAAEGAWSAEDRALWQTRMVQMPLRAESSTAVRTEGQTDHLHEPVSRFISEHGLYRS